MRGEKHLQNARELEVSIRELAKLDPDKHIRLIVEGAFGAAHHYIAYGCDLKHGVHSDKHEGVPAMLRRLGREEISKIFERLDTIRHGRFYGSKRNGEIVEEILQLLENLKRWLR
jgi:hypothetical protein